jgi:methionine synthase II (cobalamin-independent)
MGIRLKGPGITRGAFSVLVSEHAMKIAGGLQRMGHHFDRKTYEINEDLAKAIEIAGASLEARVEDAMKTLFSAEMEWLDSLPEFRKLANFTQNHNTAINQKLVSSLRILLRQQIRAGVVGNYFKELPDIYIDHGNRHRVLEHRSEEELTRSFDEMYASLENREKPMCSYFWGLLQRSDWANDHSVFDLTGRYQTSKTAAIAEFKLVQIDQAVLRKKSDEVNEAMFAVGIQQNGQEFRRGQFYQQVAEHVGGLTRQMMAVYDGFIFQGDRVTDTLLCLTDVEFQYLPLWAHGNEDGFGAVFKNN